MTIRRIAALAAALLLWPTAGFADTMTWQVRSFHRNTAEISFFSQNRKVQWPGNGKVWVINDYNLKTYKLTCITGEKICYGAWLKGNTRRYWGVGYGGTQRCSNCCVTCNGNNVTSIMNLNE